MAKPKVMRVKSFLDLRDLLWEKKIVDGGKVCLSVPKDRNKVNRMKYRLVAGRLKVEYREDCSCCGGRVTVKVVKGDGSEVLIGDDHGRGLV